MSDSFNTTLKDLVNSMLSNTSYTNPFTGVGSGAPNVPNNSGGISNLTPFERTPPILGNYGFGGGGGEQQFFAPRVNYTPPTSPFQPTAPPIAASLAGTGGISDLARIGGDGGPDAGDSQTFDGGELTWDKLANSLVNAGATLTGVLPVGIMLNAVIANEAKKPIAEDFSAYGVVSNLWDALWGSSEGSSGGIADLDPGASGPGSGLGSPAGPSGFSGGGPGGVGMGGDGGNGGGAAGPGGQGSGDFGGPR